MIWTLIKVPFMLCLINGLWTIEVMENLLRTAGRVVIQIVETNYYYAFLASLNKYWALKHVL